MPLLIDRRQAAIAAYNVTITMVTVTMPSFAA